MENNNSVFPAVLFTRNIAMNKIIVSLFFLVLFGICSTSHAQELNFQVTINSPATTVVDPVLYKKLKNEVRELMNNTQWTNVEYQDHEKIDGNIVLTISKELSATSFEGELTIQTSRPVYMSTYKTPVLRYLDKNVVFTYDGVQPLVRSQSGYTDNLSSILTFYAYVVLAYDADTNASYGGDTYFTQAFDVYNNLPSNIQNGDKGWESKPNGDNRYSLLSEINSPRLKDLRSAIYDYHREGMDHMFEDYTKSRATLISAITTLGESFKNNNRSIAIRAFVDTKRQEIVEIFKVAEGGEKQKVRDVMLRVDASNSALYNRNLK